MTAVKSTSGLLGLASGRKERTTLGVTQYLGDHHVAGLELPRLVRVPFLLGDPVSAVTQVFRDDRSPDTVDPLAEEPDVHVGGRRATTGRLAPTQRSAQ